jgi:uncharacterized protein
MISQTISLSYDDNKMINKVVSIIKDHVEINTLWDVINVNAQKRMKMTDHGPIHFQVVANTAIKMAKILKKNGVRLSITEDFDLGYQYGELVILLASFLHDIGMSINRGGHEEFSIVLANSLLRELLDFLPVRERTIVTSETLHAIINHRSDGKPLTIEAGIVRVADALDITSGRSKFSYKQGNVDIHNISATAIDAVEIISVKRSKPILVKITMNNSSGLFQIDELLNNKLSKSGIQNYIEIRAHVTGKSERKLIKDFLIK